MHALSTGSYLISPGDSRMETASRTHSAKVRDSHSFLRAVAVAVRQGKTVRQVKYSKARKVQAVQRGQGQADSASVSSTVKGTTAN